jgi:CAAX protease family protein
MSNIPEDDPLSAAEGEAVSAKAGSAGFPEVDGLGHAPISPIPGQSLPGESTEDSRLDAAQPLSWPAEALPGEAMPTEAESPAVEPAPIEPSHIELTAEEPPMFQAIMRPEPPRQVRIPHFGHFLLLLLILMAGFACAIVVILIALHFHLYGVSSIEQTKTEIHYTLGSEGLGYLFTFFGCLIVFPLMWKKPFFAGIQWNGATALRLRWRLVGAAFLCFLLALLNSVVLPGPSHAPIESIFREPGAAWLLFGFGVTFAPFFEEMFFRGFLLPTLCTAYDWIAEKAHHIPALPLDENGHPQWSFSAMAIASVVTSLPFAWLHAAQTGYSLGPFLLLVCVSIVLCGVRLATKSLAASTLVHASYNFMLFAMMLVASHGFRHLEKM